MNVPAAVWDKPSLSMTMLRSLLVCWHFCRCQIVPINIFRPETSVVAMRSCRQMERSNGF